MATCAHRPSLTSWKVRRTFLARLITKKGLVIHPMQASVPFSFRCWEHDLPLASLGHEAGPWSFSAGLEFTSNCRCFLKHSSVDPGYRSLFRSYCAHFVDEEVRIRDAEQIVPVKSVIVGEGTKPKYVNVKVRFCPCPVMVSWGIRVLVSCL